MKARPAGRPRRARSGASTPERILRSAGREFAAAGFAGADLARIASAAGIRRSSLLHHFPSKARLYAAVARRSLALLSARLAPHAAGEGSAEGLVAGLTRSFGAFVAENPDAARLILRQFVERRGEVRDLLLRGLGSLLDGLERELAAAAGGRLRPGLPLRAAILQSASAVLLAGAAGERRRLLWGGDPEHARLAALLFLPARPAS